MDLLWIMKMLYVIMCIYFELFFCKKYFIVSMLGVGFWDGLMYVFYLD